MIEQPYLWASVSDLFEEAEVSGGKSVSKQLLARGSETRDKEHLIYISGFTNDYLQ